MVINLPDRYVDSSRIGALMRLGSIDRMALSEEERALVHFVNEQSTALDCSQAVSPHSWVSQGEASAS